ncbi:MAG: flagellar export chaperone FliS [Blastocatellia bacterium]
MIKTSRLGLAAYNQVASLESDKVKQIGLLYEGAIKFLQLAANDIETKDLVAKAEHTKRALDIISYLQSILDFERGGEVAKSLDNFYSSITRLIISGSFKLDASIMRQSAELMTPVCEAWFINAKANVAGTSL